MSVDETQALTGSNEMAKNYDGWKLVINVAADIRGVVENSVWDAIKNNAGQLPAELSDLFTLTQVADTTWRLDFA